MIKNQVQAPKEPIVHGTSRFPLACYFWNGGKYSVHLPIHWHPEAEIIYFDEGSFILTIGSEQVNVEAPAFLLIPCNVAHNIVLPGNSIQRSIVFNPEIVRLSQYDDVQNTIFEEIFDNAHPVLPIMYKDSEFFSEAQRYFEFICNNYKTENLDTRLLVKLNVAALLTIFDSFGMFNKTTFSTDFEKNRQQKFKDLINWIHDHYAGPLSITDAANRMQFSEAYFCRFFKKATHMSFTEYLNDYRLGRASEAVLEGVKSISEIASSNGFENESYFFRLFKKKYGVTPLKFRKKV